MELPANPSKNDPSQFDYGTIADVILHLRYTAREGGGLLRNGAVGNLTSRIEEAQAAGSVRLFSVRHEFPSEWAKFKSVKIEGDIKTSPLALELRQEHFPFWSQGRLKAVKRVDWFAKNGKAPLEITENADGTGNKDTLVQDKSLGNLWIVKLTNPPEVETKPQLSIKFNLNFTDNSMEDLWLALAWGKGD